MNDTVYEVYETDADDTMDPQKRVHTGRSFDIAESVMVKLFEKAFLSKDFLLYDVKQKHIIAGCLSPATAFKRGICQG